MILPADFAAARSIALVVTNSEKSLLGNCEVLLDPSILLTSERSRRAASSIFSIVDDVIEVFGESFNLSPLRAVVLSMVLIESD